MIEPTPGLVTLTEFEELLARSDVKLECIAGEPLAFAGGSVAHGILCAKVISMLTNATRANCQTFTSDVALLLPNSGSYVFPDASYTCERLDPSAIAIRAPMLVVEVISADSVRRDRVEKLDAYQSLSSIQEYLLIDSRRTWVAVYRRSGPTWTETTYHDPENVVELVCVDIKPTLGELYAGTERIRTA